MDDEGDSTPTLVDPPLDSPPFDERLVFQRVDGDLRAPLSNPWFYKERFTDGDPIEGLDRPLWICVFADNVDLETTPTGDQPERSFEITDGSIEPNMAVEPTNDSYIGLKRHTDGATLKYLAHQASAAHEFYFDEELLFNTSEIDEGATFELPA